MMQGSESTSSEGTWYYSGVCRLIVKSWISKKCKSGNFVVIGDEMHFSNWAQRNSKVFSLRKHMESVWNGLYPLYKIPWFSSVLYNRAPTVPSMKPQQLSSAPLLL